MLHYQAGLQEAFNEAVTAEPVYDSVKSVFTSATRSVVDALLSKDEAALPPGIKGSPDFVSTYTKDGIAASDGRSLRDLSLRRKLYRYRCSPLIYSEMFLSIPDSLKQQIYSALSDALHPTAADPQYDYISTKERAAIRAILKETHPELRAILTS